MAVILQTIIHPPWNPSYSLVINYKLRRVMCNFMYTIRLFFVVQCCDVFYISLLSNNLQPDTKNIVNNNL